MPETALPDVAASRAGDHEPLCLACGSQDSELWAEATDIEYCTSDRAYAYLRCKACDCLWIDPVPADSLEAIYPSNYYSYSGEDPSFIGRVKNALDRRVFRALVSEIPGQKLRALDIGGGSGSALDILQQADARIHDTVVLDMDDGAKRIAESRGHDFVHGRIEDYAPDGLYDLVLMLNLIEHVANPAEVLRKVTSLLKPGGRIIVKTPNWRSLDHYLFRHQSWGGYHCPRHWVLWTMPGFRILVESCGLEVVSAKFTQGAPFWAISVLNILNRAGFVSVTAQRPISSHPLLGPLCGIFAVFDYLRKPFSNCSQMVFILTRSD